MSKQNIIDIVLLDFYHDYHTLTYDNNLQFRIHKHKMLAHIYTTLPISPRYEKTAQMITAYRQRTCDQLNT